MYKYLSCCLLLLLASCANMDVTDEDLGTLLYSGAMTEVQQTQAEDLCDDNGGLLGAVPINEYRFYAICANNVYFEIIHNVIKKTSLPVQ